MKPYRVILTVGEQWEADLILGFLKSEGISAIQDPRPALTLLHYPPIRNFSPGIKILVPESDLEKSLRLLQSKEQKQSKESPKNRRLTNVYDFADFLKRRERGR